MRGRHSFCKVLTNLGSYMQAQKCLSILQGSEAVRAELKAYQAVLQLKGLGIKILPMQFLQVRIQAL